MSSSNQELPEDLKNTASDISNLGFGYYGQVGIHPQFHGKNTISVCQCQDGNLEAPIIYLNLASSKVLKNLSINVRVVNLGSMESVAEFEMVSGTLLYFSANCHD